MAILTINRNGYYAQSRDRARAALHQRRRRYVNLCDVDATPNPIVKNNLSEFPAPKTINTIVVGSERAACIGKSQADIVTQSCSVLIKRRFFFFTFFLPFPASIFMFAENLNGFDAIAKETERKRGERIDDGECRKLCIFSPRYNHLPCRRL